MSENYRFYVEKMADARARRLENRPLLSQVEELFRAVQKCESTWALEDRIEAQSKWGGVNPRWAG